MFCPNCGKQSNGDKFCTNCGASLQAAGQDDSPYQPYAQPAVQKPYVQQVPSQGAIEPRDARKKRGCGSKILTAIACVFLAFFLLIVIGTCSSESSDDVSGGKTEKTQEQKSKKDSKSDSGKFSEEITLTLTGSDSLDAVLKQRSDEERRQIKSKSIAKQLVDYAGYTDSQAKKIAKVMKKVGLTDFEFVDVGISNGSLQSNRANCYGHQVNFTTDGGELFYVNITGWRHDVEKLGWYTTWYGKVKFGTHVEKDVVNFDLYATDIENGGVLGKYVPDGDKCVPLK